MQKFYYLEKKLVGSSKNDWEPVDDECTTFVSIEEARDFTQYILDPEFCDGEQFDVRGSLFIETELTSSDGERSLYYDRWQDQEVSTGLQDTLEECVIQTQTYCEGDWTGFIGFERYMLVETFSLGRYPNEVLQ